MMQQAVYFATLKATYLGAKSGILAVGINGNPALTQFQSWLTAGEMCGVKVLLVHRATLCTNP